MGKTIKANISTIPTEISKYISNFDINYVTPKDALLGTFISYTLDLNLLNLPINLDNIKINIEVEGINVSFPTFILRDKKQDKLTGEVCCKGIDYGTKFDIPFEPSRINFPCTLLELAKEICNYCNVELAKQNFINNDFIVEKKVIDEKNSCGEIIGMIASASAGIAFINGEDKLEIKSITDSEIVIDNIFENELINQKIGPINAVNIAREPIKDYIVLKDDESIDEYGKTEIKISNNALIDDNRENAITNIYNKLKEKEFYCEKITTYEGYKIKPFDLINVSSEKVLVNCINIKYPNLLDGYVGIEQLSKIDSEFNIAKGLEKRVIDAEAKVNKVEGEIVLAVSKSEEALTKATEIKQTNETITNTVSDIKQQVDNATGDITTIEKTVNALEENVSGLKNTLETQGGSNLLLNSSGLFQNEHWEGSVKNITSTDIQNNFIAKACFNLQNGSMKQTVNVVNGSYYVGFKYQKLLELANCKILINGTEIELTSTTLKEVDNVIEVSEHSITIELISDTDNACLIGDIIVVQGSKQSWSSNMNEIYTNTVKIGIGMEITSNTMNTRLLANADGVRIVNTTNNTVKTEFTDKGTKTDELEANTAKIAGILIQKNNNQTWISSLL